MEDNHLNKRYFIKDEEGLKKEFEEKYRESGVSVNKGSIAMLFGNIVVYFLSKAYLLLEKLHINCFVSTADREHLELMAKDSGISFDSSTSTENLRYNVKLSNVTGKACNKTSIKENILSRFKGITNLSFEEFSAGSGSVTIFLNSNNESESELSAVKSYIKEIAPCGVAFYIKYPERSVVKFKIKISTGEKSDTILIDIKKATNNALLDIFNVEKQSITIEEVTRAIIASHSAIITAKIFETAIDGEVFKFNKLISESNLRYVVSTDNEIIF